MIGPLARLRGLGGALGLATLVAGLAGGTVAAGLELCQRARAERAAVPREARFFVVVRSPLADVAREALPVLPGLRVLDERRLEELLPARPRATAAHGRLRVIETAVDLYPGADLARSLEAMRAVDGVVDVIEVNGHERAARTPARAARSMAAGLLLAAVGSMAFLAGVIRAATLAASERRDEIAARHVLGEDAARLWRPFGAAIGAASVLGVGVALGLLLVVGALLGSVPGRAADQVLALPGGVDAVHAGVGGALALLLGASAVAALAARRAVARIVERAAVVMAFALLIGPRPALAEEGARVDPETLRSVARELAVSRHALHRAERSLLETDLLAVRAVAAGDPVLVRLAAARREADLIEVARWRLCRDALRARRAEVREARRAERDQGPPVSPRLAPLVAARASVPGEVGGRREEGQGFRGAVAFRARAGEVVRASATGRVVYAGELGRAGPVVVVSHGRRTFTVYARLGEVLVARGMQVLAGEAVGRAPAEPGSIYFGVREGGRPVAPEDWLRTGDDLALARWTTSGAEVGH